jgi:hypothetical protein
MDFPFRIPGTSRPDIVVSRSFLGTVAVRVDGAPVKATRRQRNLYPIPLPDGSTDDMILSGQWTGLRAQIHGQTIALERPLSPWELVLTLLPLALIVGGAVGAVIGLIGSAVSTQIVRQADSVLTRIVLPIGIGAASVAAYVVVIAIVFSR